MYKQSFSCKINRTEVKYTATKLHVSPDKTDRAQRRSLLQKADSDSEPKPGLQGTPTPHACSLECSSHPRLRDVDLPSPQPVRGGQMSLTNEGVGLKFQMALIFDHMSADLQNNAGSKLKPFCMHIL